MKKTPSQKPCDAKAEAAPLPSTFAELARQRNWGVENKSPTENPPSAPLTYAEAMRKMNWGAGDQAMNPDPNTDRYFITTTGTTDPNWTPGEEDWKWLAEMFRGR
jgi:hypothetical protein